MMQIKKPKTWQPADLYQEFAKSLLAANPEVMETIEVKIRSGMANGKVRYKIRKRQVQVGGYWGKRNLKNRMNNHWIYNRVRLPSGQQKIVEVMSWPRWKKIMESYFLGASDRIIMGESLNMTNRLGFIEPRHIERNHENRQINFHETGKQPKVLDPDTGKMKAAVNIYFTDDSYPRIAWRKNRQITGERSYEFLPCHGDEKGLGFKQRFSEANLQNPALKFTYPWYPRILPIQNTA